MRISDWSSDVCSSDLITFALQDCIYRLGCSSSLVAHTGFLLLSCLGVFFFRFLLLEIEPAASIPRGHDRRRLVVIQEKAFHFLTPKRRSQDEQIGRASCRASVCQYV